MQWTMKRNWFAINSSAVNRITRITRIKWTASGNFGIEFDQTEMRQTWMNMVYGFTFVGLVSSFLFYCGAGIWCVAAFVVLKTLINRANDVSSLISQCCTGGGVSTHHSHNPNQIEHKINRRLSSRLRVVSTHYCVRATYIHMHMNSAHNIQSRTPTQ